MNNKDEVCCPPFDPKLWDEKEVVWKDKLFVVGSMPQILHIPFPGAFEKTVKDLWAKIEAANAKIEGDEFLMLSQDPSPWKSNLYINVTKEVPDAKNIHLSGTFVAKVFDGPFQDIPKYMKGIDDFLAGRNQKAIDYFFYYTTCPKCAKKYGHNYIVVFAKIK